MQALHRAADPAAADQFAAFGLWSAGAHAATAEAADPVDAEHDGCDDRQADDELRHLQLVLALDDRTA